MPVLMFIHSLSNTPPGTYVSHFLQFSYLFLNPLFFSPSFSLSVIFQSPFCLYIAFFVFYLSPSILLLSHTHLSCVIFCLAQSNKKMTRRPDKDPRTYAYLSVPVLSFSISFFSLSYFLFSLSSLAGMCASIVGLTFIVDYTSRYVCACIGIPFLTI